MVRCWASFHSAQPTELSLTGGGVVNRGQRQIVEMFDAVLTEALQSGFAPDVNGGNV